MSVQHPPQKLQVASHFAVHIVEKDDVVVLYNCDRPLLLKGNDKVRLFQYINSLSDKCLGLEDFAPLSEELVLLAARLLQKNVLEYVVPENACL